MKPLRLQRLTIFSMRSELASFDIVGSGQKSPVPFETSKLFALSLTVTTPYVVAY